MVHSSDGTPVTMAATSEGVRICRHTTQTQSYGDFSVDRLHLNDPVIFLHQGRLGIHHVCFASIVYP